MATGATANTYTEYDCYFPDYFLLNNPCNIVIGNYNSSDYGIVCCKDLDSYITGGSGLTTGVGVKAHTNPFIIFAEHHNGTPRGTNGVQIHGFVWKRENTDVRNMWACEREADNVLGMYDFTNNTFYTNAGSGAFSKGSYE